MKVIFCDFDGTITESDNILAIMQHIQPPGWEDLLHRLVKKRSLSIRQAVGAMFRLIPASRQKEVVDFPIRNARIREWFGSFVEYCREQDIQLLVTSGGIDFFVYPLLEPFGIPRERIFCNASSFEGDRIEIIWPHSCDEYCQADCGMCKTSIIRGYNPEEYTRILIGDSITDFEGAKLVEKVFARSHLVDLCKKKGYPYHRFETFTEIIRHLKEMNP